MSLAAAKALRECYQMWNRCMNQSSALNVEEYLMHKTKFSIILQLMLKVYKVR